MAKTKSKLGDYYAPWPEEATLNAMDKSLVYLKGVTLCPIYRMTEEGRDLAKIIIEDAITLLQEYKEQFCPEVNEEVTTMD